MNSRLRLPLLVIGLLLLAAGSLLLAYVLFPLPNAASSGNLAPGLFQLPP